MLPNFLHVGAGKCASSWLWRVLQEHPGIYVPERPDNVNFFTVHYHRGLDWYEQTYFAAYDGENAVGEFSNSYMCYHPALERIARHLPGARLTMTLRNPVVRAFLSWAHVHLKKKNGLDPDRGIGVPFEKCLHHHGHAWFRHWIEPGFYARHIEHILSLFPREHILIMLHEDLCDDPNAFMRRYYEFLEVDPHFQSTLIGREINPGAPGADPAARLAPEFREELWQVYREDIQRLQEILRRDLSHWK